MQVLNYLKLPVIHPSSNSDQNKAEWIENYRHLVRFIIDGTKYRPRGRYFQQDLISGPDAIGAYENHRQSKPKNPTMINHHHEAIRTRMRDLFIVLRVAT